VRAWLCFWLFSCFFFVVFFFLFLYKPVLSIPIYKSHCCRFFETRKRRLILMWESYLTSLGLLRCPFVSEVMYGNVPEVFLHQ
jgi:hypothetical protein